jgi:LysR family transcriptional regulator for metE and metH
MNFSLRTGKTMNGAELLLKTASQAGIEICFANAGTTELPIVAAFDSVLGIRPVLGLFEGVCTGAADGYGRMKRRPAMNLEIRHLKLVEAVAETGSITRAGHRLHLTQSALSHQLRDAEEQLGAPLFERKNGKMILTSAGERLLQAARAVLTELQRAESEIHKNGAPTKGLLRISTQCHTAYHWFPPRLLLFQKKFPNVEVQLVLEAAYNPFEPLLDGKLDLAIICDPIRNRKIRYTPLFEDDALVVVPPGHPFAAKEFVAPKDFSTETLLVYPPKSESTLLTKILEPAGIQPRKIQEILLTEVILEMIVGGLGIAALPRWAVAPQLSSGLLIGVPLQPPGYRWLWSVAQLRDVPSPPYVQEFIRLISDPPSLTDFFPRGQSLPPRFTRQVNPLLCGLRPAAPHSSVRTPPSRSRLSQMRKSTR